MSLLTADQAGALLGVPKTWVLAEARADGIPHMRLGRYVRFDADALEAWWRSRARGHAPCPRRRSRSDVIAVCASQTHRRRKASGVPERSPK